MKHFAGAAFAALVVGAGVALAPFAGASASGCRGDKEGEAHVPGVGPAATHAAIRAAIADWEREVLEDCGVHVPWSTAHQPHIRCKERSDATKCKVEATPSF
jgi:hypothetical protein